MENQKLFVGNLNFETTEDDVNQLFSAYGTVQSIRFRQKKGFAFVEMSKPEEAAAALLNLNQSDFNNRPLRISLELPKKKAKKLTRGRFIGDSKKKSAEKKKHDLTIKE